MGYLDNTTIIVDAELTRKGRQILAQRGTINITAFALSDDEIDYSLYDPTAAIPDLAIVNTPVFEPSTDDTQVMKYKLVTLPPGTTTIPQININIPSISVIYNSNSTVKVSATTTPATYNANLGYTAILANGNAGILSVTQALTTTSITNPSVTTLIGDVSSQNSQIQVGFEFAFTPNINLRNTLITTLTLIGNESGGSISIPVTVTYQ